VRIQVMRDQKVLPIRAGGGGGEEEEEEGKKGRSSQVRPLARRTTRWGGGTEGKRTICAPLVPHVVPSRRNVRGVHGLGPAGRGGRLGVYSGYRPGGALIEALVEARRNRGNFVDGRSLLEVRVGRLPFRCQLSELRAKRTMGTVAGAPNVLVRNRACDREPNDAQSGEAWGKQDMQPALVEPHTEHLRRTI